MNGEVTYLDLALTGLAVATIFVGGIYLTIRQRKQNRGRDSNKLEVCCRGAISTQGSPDIRHEDYQQR